MACTGAPSVVPCESAEQCARGSRAGRCEATGLCSFADDSCATQRRYDEDYAGAASGTCVPVETPTWATQIGGVTVDALDELTTDDHGRVVAYGRFFDRLSVPQQLDGAGNYDLLLASLEQADGAVRWLAPFGSALSEAPGGISAAGARLHLGGRFSAVMSLFGAELMKGSPGQAFGTFHATIVEENGAPVLRGAAVTQGSGVATATDVDGMAIAGEWQGGALDLTGGSSDDAVDAVGISAWIALAEDVGWGATATFVPAQTGGEIRVSAVARSGSAVAFGGRYSGAISFRGAQLLPAAQQSDGYVASWQPGAPTAAPQVTLVRGAGPDELHDLVVVDGELVAAAEVTSSVTVGGVATSPIGVKDALVFGVTGRHRAWRAGAPGGVTIARALAATANGVIVAGTFDRPLRLGARVVEPRGGADVFVALVRADGSVPWAHALGGPQDDDVASVVVTTAGLVVLGVTFQETIELGGGATRRSAGDGDWLVVAYAPW